MAPKKVAQKLDSGSSLEHADSQGHRTGPLKFNYLGLREAYGRGKLGLEFRGGFGSGHTVDSFLKKIDRVVYVLGHLGDLHGQMGDKTTSVSLMTHYDFANKYSPLSAVPPELKGFLRRSAEECIKGKLTSKLKVPWQSERNPDVLVGRWALAFIPWENHPLATNGTCGVRIKCLREALIAALRSLMGKARRTHRNTPNLTVSPPDVSALFAEFFGNAQIGQMMTEVSGL